MTTYFSGLVDESDLCFLGNHPLEDVLGIEQEEIDAPMEEFPNSFRYQGTDYSAGELREVIHAKDGCEILSVYEEDYVKGMPVLTRNSYGSGKAYYLAAVPGMDFLRAFLGDLLAELSLENLWA